MRILRILLCLASSCLLCWREALPMVTSAAVVATAYKETK